jgi:hypothetical protein
MTSKLTFGLYALGVVFLILAGRSWYGATNIPDEDRQFLVVNESFAYDALRGVNGFRSTGSPAELKTDQLVAIFPMPADPCTDCLNEVHAYLAVFEQGGLHGKPVHSDIVVVGEDLMVARRFAKTSDFEQEVLYGTGEVHGEQLHSFGTTAVTHQLVLVDPDQRRLFFRARLALGAGSAPEAREEIL